MATLAPQQRNVATPAQVAQAFSTLSSRDQQALRQIAKLRAIGLQSMTWEDLLHEALYRALAGARLWPLNVNLVAFLAQTMRSIASEERGRATSEPVDYSAEHGAKVEAPSPLESVADARTPESDLVTRQAISKVEAIFAGDLEALHLIHGLAEGLTPAETQARSGMTTVQYASAQRRIQRALARSFGKASDD